eukprot:GHRR01004026.1.p1 GENE.GHRR01004026.1~~GHRR01004026.1.p1  ORF type:complete len:257 (+),score=85.16 GHRR01004026.1:193-963(+)
MLNCSCHRPAMLQKATISTLCLPSVRPTAVVAGSCRKRCVRAFASASQDRHEQLHSSIDSTASSNRRQLLAGTVAAAIGPVLLGAATAAAAVAPAAEAVSASATVASAATPVQSRANSTYQIVTEEGTVRLFTNDQVAKNMTPTDRQVFALNRRVQAQNRTPDDFPGFIRQGFDITVVGEGYVMDQNGLVYKDFVEGSGSNPTDGQQVVFDYTGYNESGAIIDSSYRKGRPAETRIGIQGLIPGEFVCPAGTQLRE